MLLRTWEGKIFKPIDGKLTELLLPYADKVRKVLRCKFSSDILLILTERGEVYRYVEPCFVKIHLQHDNHDITAWDITFIYNMKHDNAQFMVVDGIGHIYRVQANSCKQEISTSDIKEILSDCYRYHEIPPIDNFVPNNNSFVPHFSCRDDRVVSFNAPGPDDFPQLSYMEDLEVTRFKSPVGGKVISVSVETSFKLLCFCSDCKPEQRSHCYGLIHFSKFFITKNYCYVLIAGNVIEKLFHGQRLWVPINDDPRYQRLSSNNTEIIERLLLINGGLYFRFDNYLATIEPSEVNQVDLEVWNSNSDILEKVEEMNQYM